MPRNLYNRVELVVPVEDERARAELLDVLDRCLADTPTPGSSAPTATGSAATRAPSPRSVQRELIERHVARASESAL